MLDLIEEFYFSIITNRQILIKKLVLLANKYSVSLEAPGECNLDMQDVVLNKKTFFFLCLLCLLCFSGGSRQGDQSREGRRG